jgi:hypothetical protein
MAEAGEIDKLWRDFHIALKSAREKTVCYFYKRVARCGTKYCLISSLSWDERRSTASPSDYSSCPSCYFYYDTPFSDLDGGCTIVHIRDPTLRLSK